MRELGDNGTMIPEEKKGGKGLTQLGGDDRRKRGAALREKKKKEARGGGGLLPVRSRAVSEKRGLAKLTCKIFMTRRGGRVIGEQEKTSREDASP